MWKRDQQHTLPQRQGKRGGGSAADSLKKLTVEKGADDGTRLMHAATYQEDRRETIGKNSRQTRLDRTRREDVDQSYKKNRCAGVFPSPHNGFMLSGKVGATETGERAIFTDTK